MKMMRGGFLQSNLLNSYRYKGRESKLRCPARISAKYIGTKIAAKNPMINLNNLSAG